MAYRTGNRYQMNLFPQSLEEYVEKDDPVRAYDAFIEALNLKELGLKINPNKVGNSSYEPKTMLKLLTYSYSYGWQSSRKIERAVHHNVSFMWLTGGLKPDHKTIAEFRHSNKITLKRLLVHCARMCIQLELIEGNVLFADGTKIRANASRNKNYTKEQYSRKLALIDKHIAKLLDDCERIDIQEQNNDSLIKMREELADSQKLKNKIQDLLVRFKEEDTEQKTINATDPDCRIMKSIQGSHASYNVQSVVDAKNGLIVHSDAEDDVNDRNQLSKQIKAAQETTDKRSKIVCADAGYFSTDVLKELDDEEINVIVPNQDQVSNKESNPFSKTALIR